MPPELHQLRLTLEAAPHPERLQALRRWAKRAEHLSEAEAGELGQVLAWMLTQEDPAMLALRDRVDLAELHAEASRTAEFLGERGGEALVSALLLRTRTGAASHRVEAILALEAFPSHAQEVTSQLMDLWGRSAPSNAEALLQVLARLIDRAPEAAQQRFLFILQNKLYHLDFQELKTLSEAVCAYRLPEFLDSLARQCSADTVESRLRLLPEEVGNRLLAVFAEARGGRPLETLLENRFREESREVFRRRLLLLLSHSSQEVRTVALRFTPRLASPENPAAAEASRPRTR